MPRAFKDVSHKCNNLHKKSGVVSEEMSRKILAATALVVPVGTAICRNCEKAVLVSKTTSDKENNSEVDVVDGSGDRATEKNNEEDSAASSTAGKRKKTEMQGDAAKRTKVLEDVMTQEEAIQDNWTEYEMMQDRKFRQCRTNAPSLKQMTNSDDLECVSLSQSSVDSIYMRQFKLDAFSQFLNSVEGSPIPEIQGTFKTNSASSRSIYISRAEEYMDIMLDILCPGETELVWKEMQLNHGVDTSSPSSSQFEPLIEIYTNAESKLFRKQVLSVLAKRTSHKDLKAMIPDLKEWRYYVARNAPIRSAPEVNRQIRQKMKPELLEHFLDYITSSEVCKDLPFGERSLKLTNGEILKIPNVVRCLAPAALIEQYKAVCKEQNLKHLADSTLFKILEDCGASVRKSLEGLDNFAMEASRAFQFLESHLVKLGKKELRSKLMEAKLHLKTDFKRTLSQHCHVADHCINLALSDPDPKQAQFKNPCVGDHTHTCLMCQKLDDVLEECMKVTLQSTWANEDAILFQIEKAVADIYLYKGHIVRSINQDRARSDVFDGMVDGDIVLTCDWAMKFLPRRFREGQIDWFGKRGLNWHVAVATMKDQDEMKSKTYIHIFEHQTPQNAAVTAAVIVDVVKDLKKDNNAGKLYICSDNAGCYKSSPTILYLNAEIGELVNAYHFTEAQNGKGPCDRRASHAKATIKRHVNAGNDVVTAKDMKQALDMSKVNVQVRVVDAVEDVEEAPKTKIKAISSFFNFNFEDDGVRVWRGYGIGEGKHIPLEGLETDPPELKVIHDWGDDVDFKAHRSSSEGKTNVTFLCPDEACDREFMSEIALDKHVLSGICSYRDVKMCTPDTVKINYRSKLQKVPCTNVRTDCRDVNGVMLDGELKVKMGWAIKINQKKKKFNKKQKDFLQDKFDIGKRTGCKADPFSVSEEMMVCGKFAKDEFLSAIQITGAFSRISQKERNMDFSVAKMEVAMDILKHEICNTI